MNSPFIEIHSTVGRIGRICWVNSSLERDPRRFAWAVWPDGHQTLIPRGWWGSCYLCSPHPARPEEAW